MPENVALTPGEGGLRANLSALVPLMMRKLQRDAGVCKPDVSALPVAKGNGAAAP